MYRSGFKLLRTLLPRALALALVLAACGPVGSAPTAESSEVTSANRQVSVAETSTTPAEAQGNDVAAAPASAPPVEPPAQLPAANAQFVDASGAAAYSGEIVARSKVNVVAEVNGEVLGIAAKEGDHVKAGDELVQLDSVRLEAQAAQALAGLQVAQAQLDLMTTPPKEADLAAAKAAVAAAGSAYRKATAGATDEDLRIAEAQLRAAKAGVTAAQASYNRVKGDQYIATRPENLQLQQAKLQVEAAQARYDQLNKGATQDIISAAYAQLAQAQANLTNLENGPSEEQVQAVQAQVKQAEAGLYLAELQVSKASIRAPVDGVVSRIATSVGATASSGGLMAELLSEEVQVTIPVEETRLPTLAVGQPAEIQVAAYPDQKYPGKVALIAPEVDPATRTVQVTIRPNAATPELADGMFATVQLLSQ